MKNGKIIILILSLTLLTNTHVSLPSSSPVETCIRFASKSLVAATIIGIISLPFFIKNKDKNSKALKKQSLIKLLQISLLGGIGNTAFSLFSDKEKPLPEENKGIELQPLPAQGDTDTKSISDSPMRSTLIGTAFLTGFGSLCTVIFSRLSNPFKKSKKPSIETRINWIERKIGKNDDSVWQQTSGRVLDAFVTAMQRQCTGNEAEIKGINFEEFTIKLALLSEKFKEFEPKFNKIVENYCADIKRSSPDDTKNLATQLAAFNFKLTALETEIADIRARITPVTDK